MKVIEQEDDSSNLGRIRIFVFLSPFNFTVHAGTSEWVPSTCLDESESENNPGQRQRASNHTLSPSFYIFSTFFLRI